MSLNRRSIELLLDLVDNKLTSMQVIDRDDQRDYTMLERVRNELEALAGIRREPSVATFSAQRRPAHRVAA
jgi:hypothetical protein